jgi:uncharacterized protein YciI
VYWILFYDVVDDYVERRGAYRAEHLGLASKAVEDGSLVLAGALAEPPDGAVLIFKSDSSAVAEAFAENDPYVREGIVTSWRVRQWTVVAGQGIEPPSL